MAQWQELLKLDSALQSRVSQIYERLFPREIRHCLCDWIESQDWDYTAVDENRARTCFHALLEYLEEQWNRSVQHSNILQGPDFQGMKDYLIEHFQDEPVKLAILLSKSLKEEKKILSSVTVTQSFSNPGMQLMWRELDNKVTELKCQLLELKKEVKTLEGLNEKLDYVQMTWQSMVEKNVELTSSVVEEECVKRAFIITKTKQNVLQQLVNISNKAAQIVATLTDVELPEWKRRQQLACIGSPMDTCLEHLQKWFTTVAEVLYGVREQLQKMQDQNNKYNAAETSSLTASIDEIERLVLSLITKLLSSALVVEKQPIIQNLPHRPLILKTGVRFKVTVRFLANLPNFKGLLKVKPVFDKDIEEAIAANGFRLFEFTREYSKVFDEDTPGGGLTAEFGNMSLKERKAKTKGSLESYLGVTEELHIIRFVTVLQYAGQTLNIEASSLPVVIVSSTNQVSSAWASIMWWNTFSTNESMNLSLFSDPPPLTWQQLSQALSWQFLSIGQRALDEDQLSMLRDKLVDDPDGLVYWRKFSKDEGAWIWIDGVLDLIRKHLVDLWRDGESNKDGAVTFSWVNHSNGEIHVHAVDPYTKKELVALSLPDAINSYTLSAPGRNSNPLQYLYPDIPKDTAFRRYYKVSASPETKTKTSEYIKRMLAVISINPTPPPFSPLMDDDPGMDTSETDWCQMMEDFFEFEFDILQPSYHETPFLHPPSPLANYTDPV
ncbi:signal transducer and activator of transcription 1-like isoform 2-T2 [Odontesthes bonariensis]|uniref:signal transducer and activator of transcription 1-like isoform X2 n=1 Tax=Odontesthes bonariensis TaxID=219752 RepID=UPI003F5852AA